MVGIARVLVFRVHAQFQAHLSSSVDIASLNYSSATIFTSTPVSS